MKLNNILIERNMTLRQLSEATGINISSIQKYSCEKRKPTVNNAKKIGKFLGFDWWLLFEDENDKKKTT